MVGAAGWCKETPPASGRAGRVRPDSLARPARSCWVVWIGAGLVRAKKHGTKSGTGTPPGGALFAENCPRVYAQAEKMWICVTNDTV